jgi:hypothetical protein
MKPSELKVKTIRICQRVKVVTTLAVCALLLASSSQAADITWGDVVANNLSEYGFDNSSTTVFSTDSGVTDQLYEMNGYLANGTGAIAVDSSNFSILSSISVINNVATSSISLNATGAAALGLSVGDLQIDYTFTLVDDVSPSDVDGILWDLAVANFSGADQNLSFYPYLDFDLGGIGDYSDDLVTADAGQMLLSDSDQALTFLWTAGNGGSDHFQAGDVATVKTALELMSSATPLADTSSGAIPGDFAGAFQYDIFVPNGDTYALSAGSFVPEPGTGVLLLLGLGVLALRNREADALSC